MADYSNFFAFLFVCMLIVFSDAQKPAQEDDKNKVVTYSYGYDVGSHYHNEAKDSKNVVRGEYGWMGPDGIYREYNYTADKYGFRINRRRSRVRDRYTPPTAAPGQQPTARPPVQPLRTTSQILAGRTGIPAGAFRPYVFGTTRIPSGDDDSRPGGQATTTPKASASDNLVSSTVEPGGYLEEQPPYSMDGGAGTAGQASIENGIEAHASEQANTTLLGPSSSGNGNGGFASEVDKNRSSASARADDSVSSSHAVASMNQGQSSSSSSSSASASSKVAGDGLTLSSAQATGSASTLDQGPVGYEAGESGYGNPGGSASGSDNSGFGVSGSSRTSSSRGPGTASSAKTIPDNFSVLGTEESRPAGNHPTVSSTTTRRPFMLPYPPVVYNFSRSSGPGIATRKPNSIVTTHPSKPAPAVVVPPADENGPKSYGPTFPEGQDTTASQTCNVPSFPTDQKPSGISREEQQTPDGKLIGKYKLTFPMGYVLEIAYTAYQDQSLAASDSHDGHTGSNSCK